jgi:type IV secretion system protein VirD4
MKLHLDPGAMLLGYLSPIEPTETIGFSNQSTSPPSPLPSRPIYHQLNDGPLFVVGRSGSGKGTASLIPICLDTPADTTLIVVDVKGQVSATTAEHRRRLGAHVQIVDPFGVTGSTSSGINPLDLIGDPMTLPSAADDAAMISDALVVESSRNGERFWNQSAKSAITMGCLLLAAHAPKDWKNLGALGDALGAGTGPTLTGFLAAAVCSDICGGLVRREAENLSSLSGPTLSSITATLASHLRPLTSPLVKKSLSTSDVDLDAISRGDPVTIYLTIPPDRIRSHGAVLRVWLNAFVCAIARRRERPRSHTILLIDELAQLGTLEAVRQVSYLLREMGVSLVGYLQGIDQLARLYEDDWRALLDNAGTIVSLNGGAALRRLAEITADEDAARGLPPLPITDAAVIRNGRIDYMQKRDYRLDPAYRHLAPLNRFFSSREIGDGR